MENWNDKELIKSLQKDNLKAFDTLYWKYQLRLYSNIFKLIKDVNGTQDILQEVFISLWEKRFTIDPNREVSGWLFTVSYNKSINYLRKSLKESLLFDEYDEGLQVAIHPVTDVEEDQLSIIEAAVSQLSPQKRRVFDLCKLQGKTYEETAKEMNISKHTVKEYLSGAVTNVKDYVKVNSEAPTTFLYIFSLYQFFKS